MTPEERIAELETHVQQLRATVVQTALTSALIAAKCRPDAVQDALAVLLASAQTEWSPEGGIASLTIGEDTYETPAAAAEAFMGARAYLVAAEDPKKTPHDGANPQAKPEQLAAAAFARPPAALPPAAKPKAQPSTRVSVAELIDSGQTPSELAAAGWAEPPR